jgi:hypothetical protein
MDLTAVNCPYLSCYEVDHGFAEGWIFAPLSRNFGDGIHDQRVSLAQSVMMTHLRNRASS